MPHNVALNIFLTISLKNIYTPDKKKTISDIYYI